MSSETALVGRERERAVIAQLLDAARSEESRALVVLGEPGIGKTALLKDAIESAPDMRLLRASGVQSEHELAFAGIHQLCAPLLDRLERLPDPQSEALRVAFGIDAGPAPDRFVVGLAVLSLLSDVAEERPVLCAIDDAQWLDDESALALAFVARRLDAESVAIVFALREPSEVFRGLPQAVLGGLDADNSRALLASGISGIVDEQVRDRFVAEARGNPLALFELPQGASVAELAGGFGVPEDMPLTDRIEKSFLRRLDALPDDSRRFLVTAAADPVGDSALLWRAGEVLGLRAEDAEPAQTAGLVELDGRVRFRHPLVRSAVYSSAPVSDRREAHRALAAATDGTADPDRRAWHRAQAAAGPDEKVAGELELSAERARARGGVAAMAAFLQRAAELTPDPLQRGPRSLGAAQAKLDAGAPEAAQALLAAAELTALNELERARLERLRAEITFVLRRDSEAPVLLLDAAKGLVPLDPQLARETCLEALAAAIFSGHLGNRGDVLEVVNATPPAKQPPAATDLLLNGLAIRATQGFAAGAGPLKEALEAFRRDAGETPGSSRWIWLACRIAADLWEHEIWFELATTGVRRARESGALSVLPSVASYCAGAHVHAGEFTAGSALLDEAKAVTQATHTTPLVQAKQMVAAYRGDEAAAVKLIETGREGAAARGQGMALSMIECASAVQLNATGRYDEAFGPAQRACEQDELSLYALSLIELIEAAARSGRTEAAEAALARLAERTQAAGTDWALGLEARSRALLTDSSSAEPLYDEAITRLARGRLAPHLARAQLVYGEWLRRERRRIDAREQLHAAHETFDRIGAGGFAERARRELQATGETARKRAPETGDELTPQEAQIARLARDGLTNPDIAAQLFISPRTVQYHLRKVFSKLDIVSRTQLGQVLAGNEDPAEAGTGDLH